MYNETPGLVYTTVMCKKIMDRARIKVDFNELISKNLVLLSKTDVVEDSNGNLIELKIGKEIHIYEFNIYDNGEVECLVADGVAELNNPKENGNWTKAAKWCCRISAEGIRRISIKST